ncbi:MAG: asparagine synthase (glutamine-hydrolyzing) [Bacteroidetes bacterium]|nr:asparagine synthase (glutamine-hydrolyzing) [Bacteroidota bacterium]
MCGITGIYHFDNERSIDTSLLKKMTTIIQHRGPDSEGLYSCGNIGLGHRRLSIIDLNTGAQPMFNEDKSLVLVLNGEIYNYIELRDELKRLGHIFRTKSDTEVVLKAYEEWGVDGQKKFNGMWAFALWDARKKQLFLSRDRIGEKPLNFTIFDNTFVFSSEIKSLFEYGVPREIRPELIELYLVLTNIPGPDTFYKNIYKLKPGHFMIVNSQGIQESKYWDLPEIDEENMLKHKFSIYDEFACLLEDSIKIRMRCDVPFGAFLSGGLDSSSIVAIMSKNSRYPVETFTIGFPDKDFDESKLAKLVSEKFNTNHQLGTVNPSSIEDAIKRSVFHFDEPFGDSSAIPTFQVSAFAIKKVKMVLTGDGGDEVLSGYNSYAGIKFSNKYSKLPLILQRALPKGVGILSTIFKGRMRYKLNKVVSVFETANYPFPDRIANKTAYIPLNTIKRLTANIKNIISIEDYLSNLVKNIPYQDDFYKLMYINFKNTLPDDYLVKVDRMSMANSLETRAPFLDHRLIEFMAHVDKNIKLQGWERKSILRHTIGKQLPAQLLKAPKKGFGVPLREWFKESSSENIFALKNIKSICDPQIIDQIILENNNSEKDSGNFLWTLIMLDNYLV